MLDDKNKNDQFGEDQDYGLNEDITDDDMGGKGGVSDVDESETEKSDEESM